MCGVERGTIGESRKIAIPDEMEFWYFIRRMHLANSNGKRTRGMRTRPSVTRGRPAHMCTYIQKDIVNNGTQLRHDGDVSPSDAYKRLVTGKVSLKLAVNILFIPSSSSRARTRNTRRIMYAHHVCFVLKY